MHVGVIGELKEHKARKREKHRIGTRVRSNYDVSYDARAKPDGRFSVLLVFSKNGNKTGLRAEEQVEQGK